MVSHFISQEIQKNIKYLNHTEQSKVLKYIRSLQKVKKKEEGFLSYYGSIDKDDAELIKKTIAKGCEKIDHNEW